MRKRPKCAECGREFEPRRSDQRYCCEQCRNRAYRRDPEKRRRAYEASRRYYEEHRYDLAEMRRRRAHALREKACADLVRRGECRMECEGRGRWCRRCRELAEKEDWHGND